MEKRQLTWVQFFNISFAFTSISSVVLATLGRNFFLQNDILLLFPSTVFSVMLFFIGLLGLRQRAIYVEIINTIDTLEEGKSPFQLKAKLDELFLKEKIYKHPDLKIWNVSSMLGTNRTNVLKVIEMEYGRNFCSHVNHYRVEHSKMLVSNNQNLSNEQIAELSGFNSISSLNKSFQESEKIPFDQYRRSLSN
jgi:AraC-like DNA-binding protein